VKFGVNLTGAGLFLAVILACSGRLTADPVDYSSLGGTGIKFNAAGGFSFTGGADNIEITDGADAGFLGDVTGNFTIGAVTTYGTMSVASVSGVGEFTIYDGSTNLTATLTWGNIVQIGSADTTNATGAVNLTNIHYTGTNTDLLALATADAGIDVQTFQFLPVKNLTTLKSTTITTSFSGSVVVQVPDEGTTAFLVAMGIAAVGAGMIFRSRKPSVILT